ncbi:peptide ABC transporter permease [Bacillus sp. AFS015802]|uniref:ABC transporter permease subunit n=1 Tax=Bacillus sp. AFS015802 TaxID=2033486 RepID=UPI000BF4CDD5|nr:ABC transporter permease subunit [Bacillus sp. AFS015802]PFA62812.1 peptide ABC transporter permease [Bacillus sp. AFS015802]
MVRKFARFIVVLTVITLSVISICHIPALIFKDIPPPADQPFAEETKELGFFPGNYVIELKKTIGELYHFSDISYVAQGTNVERAIFPYILESYTYSLLLLFVSLFIALFFAVLFTTGTFYLPRKMQEAVKNILTVLEALPDVFVIFSLQLGAIWVFKHTNLLVTEPYSLSGQKIYFLPILTLSLIPMIYLYKNTFLMYENELGKPYVELGVAKGMGKLYILIRHVFPNVLYSFFYNLKYMYLLLLSNMIILEYMYNIYGILQFITNHPSYEIISVALILLTFPLSIVFFFIQTFLPKGVTIYDQKAV